MNRLRSIVLLSLLLLASTARGAVAPLRVLVVLSKPDGAYSLTAQAAQNYLYAYERAPIDVTIQSLSDYHAMATPSRSHALIVTVGVDAARTVAQSNPSAPLLHTLLPRAAATEVLRDGRGKPSMYRDSAIYLDQPISRQLDLLKLALPTHRRVGVIVGPSTQADATDLRAAAKSRSLTLTVSPIKTREELLPALEKLLDANDVLLSVPDPLVYSGETIHHILLTTYRYNVPVVGLAKNYVDAGALLAVYSMPEQIGHQIADVLMATPPGGNVSLPAPDYPRYFLISVNRRVAASLELYLDSDVVLQRKLEAGQK